MYIDHFVVNLTVIGRDPADEAVEFRVDDVRVDQSEIVVTREAGGDRLFDDLRSQGYYLREADVFGCAEDGKPRVHWFTATEVNRPVPVRVSHTFDTKNGRLLEHLHLHGDVGWSWLRVGADKGSTGPGVGS